MKIRAFLGQHKWPLLTVGAVAAMAVLFVLPFPAGHSTMPQLGPEPKPLTCADLPAVQAQIDQLGDAAVKYWWVLVGVLMLVYVGFYTVTMKLVDLAEWILNLVSRRFFPPKETAA